MEEEEEEEVEEDEEKEKEEEKEDWPDGTSTWRVPGERGGLGISLWVPVPWLVCVCVETETGPSSSAETLGARQLPASRASASPAGPQVALGLAQAAVVRSVPTAEGGGQSPGGEWYLGEV